MSSQNGSICLQLDSCMSHPLRQKKLRPLRTGIVGSIFAQILLTSLYHALMTARCFKNTRKLGKLEHGKLKWKIEGLLVGFMEELTWSICFLFIGVGFREFALSNVFGKWFNLTFSYLSNGVFQPSSRWICLFQIWKSNVLPQCLGVDSSKVVGSKKNWRAGHFSSYD